MLIESAFNPARDLEEGRARPDAAHARGRGGAGRARRPTIPKQNIDAGSASSRGLLCSTTAEISSGRSRPTTRAKRPSSSTPAIPPYAETQLYVRKALAAYYGRSELGGGFGIPTSETYRGRSAGDGKPVQWTRDARTNRVTLTTKSAPRRLG